MSSLANIDLIILFFFLGVLASWLKSDLEIPPAIAKFLSIFLLLSLGLKGGHEVRAADDLSGFVAALMLGMATCLAIPTYLYFWLRKKLGSVNAASLAACYGSVSAVTLITAQGMLENDNIPYSGYIVAVMALMEIPAILLALHFYKRSQVKAIDASSNTFLSLMSAKSVILLIGGFLIGLTMNDKSWVALAPVVQDSFKGVLAFFLLDLGIAAQRQLRRAWNFKATALTVACILPLVHGILALLGGSFLGLPVGDQILVAVLAGSASYIAAPAAIKSSLPEANPSLYVALPLALTFPMNVIIGIPLYIELSQRLVQ